MRLATTLAILTLGMIPLTSPATAVSSHRLPIPATPTDLSTALIEQDAKILAARRGTSLSRLMAEELEQLVQRDQAYDKAMTKALKDCFCIFNKTCVRQVTLYPV